MGPEPAIDCVPFRTSATTTANLDMDLVFTTYLPLQNSTSPRIDEQAAPVPDGSGRVPQVIGHITL
jgi:hypothetical protein